MKAVVIGGSGHIGTFLLPRLVKSGYEVINVTRSARAPYQPHTAWDQVTQVTLDREAEDTSGTFGAKIQAMNPDVVIDLICFTPESAEQIVSALKGRIRHFLHCGTVWTHGFNITVPVTEDQPRIPIDDYGTKKAAIEKYLHREAAMNGFPATIVMPGHIVGPGWVPLNPVGNFNPRVYEELSTGKTFALPNLGLETLHHVHADDVAQIFMKAINSRSTSIGEDFHAVSDQALSLRGYAEAVIQWFGKKPDLRFLPVEKWCVDASELDAQQTRWHVSHSSHCSNEKSKRLLAYQPRYSSMDAIFESLTWLIDNGEITI